MNSLQNSRATEPLGLDVLDVAHCIISLVEWQFIHLRMANELDVKRKELGSLYQTLLKHQMDHIGSETPPDRPVVVQSFCKYP